MGFWFAKTFSRRIALFFCSLIFAAVGLTGLLLERSAKKIVIRELSSGLKAQARIIASQTAASGWNAAPGGALEKSAAALARACGCRVTFISPGGAVLGDSQVLADRLDAVENHSGRPEVRAALRGGEEYDIRRSRTVGEEFLYTAAPDIENGAPLGVVRLAVPLAQVNRETARLRSVTGWIMALMLLCALLAALWLARSLGRPVREIAQAAARFAAGDYQTRLRAMPPDEHGGLAAALNGMAGKIQAAIAELESDKGRLSAILSSMGSAVVAVSAEGRILFANEAFNALFPSGAGGKTLPEAARSPQLARMLAKTAAERRALSEELTVFNPAETVLAAQSAPLAGGGALAVLHDMTRLRRLEFARRDFTASVSHELRTPITAIKAAAETLLDGALEDQENSREFVEAINQDAQRLARLVDDILDLAAVESGRRPPKFEPVVLAEIAEEISARLKPIAAAREIIITIDGSLAALPQLRADKTQLEQIFTNLIDNAVKFNRQGGRVELSAALEGKTAVVRVKDTGVGIPQKDLPRIFERFYRVDKARSREMGGTGLGLAIVKHLAEAHGGSVSVESAEGEGSIFTVILPA
ncbi:MAG: ATP-binding protein [Elusimicrobiales bacterium]|nr:ATP-binding protein [Elusimicrobiales bacterium]